MIEKTLLALTGDESGPEIMEEGLKVAGATADLFGYKLDILKRPFGGSAYNLCGSTFPEDTKRLYMQVDGVAKAPIGLRTTEAQKLRAIGVDLERETVIEARIMPKTEANQNTDDMVYGEFLNEVSFTKMAEYLFYNERHNTKGMLVLDHPFNTPEYIGARILLGGKNFGTGSRREHAAQALKKWGIDAIIAPDYAGIFQGNCAEVGLVGVTMQIEEIEELAKLVRSIPQIQFILSLENMTLSYMAIGYGINKAAAFKDVNMPEAIRQSFLTGTWDTLPLLQGNKDAVDAYLKSAPFAKFR